MAERPSTKGDKMTYVPVNFDDIQEASAAPEGKYDLQIVQAEVKQTGPNSANPGRDQLVFTVAFLDQSLNALNIRHFVSLPHPDDEPEKARNKALMLKRFLVAFDIPFESNGIDLEKITFEALGKEARGVLVTQEPGQDGVTMYNRINLPRLQRQ
jgi:hypothetical protein